MTEFKRPPETRLLHDHGSLLVVAGLPYAHDGSVGKNLIDVSAFHPDVLHCRDGRRHHRRSRNHGGRRHYGRSRHNRSRRSHGIIDDSAYDSADEPRPEIASAAAPKGSVVSVVSVMRHVSRSRPVMYARGSAASRTSVVRTGICRSRHCKRHGEGEHEFLVHLLFLSRDVLRPRSG